VKRNVFNCLLKEAREVAVVTLVERLFHAPCTSSRHSVRSVTGGSESRSIYNQALLRAGPCYAITQKTHKARYSCLLQPPAWKWNGPILNEGNKYGSK